LCVGLLEVMAQWNLIMLAVELTCGSAITAIFTWLFCT
jgi:hypothetical protein